MEKTIERINEFEKKVYENGIYVNDGSEMNMGILEDVYVSVEDEVNWLISHAKESIKEIERLKGELESAKSTK